MCVVQWKILEPWEVGEAGQVTRARRAAQTSFSPLDRERFWKMSQEELDELKRRGVRPDAVRVIMPKSEELRAKRLKVVDFTFERVDLVIMGRQGRESHGGVQTLPVSSNVTWEELRMMIQHFIEEKLPDGSFQRFSFIYEKYHALIPLKGWEEVCGRRLAILNPKLKDADLTRLKAESKRTFAVKSELDFRQVWHWAEQEYRACLTARSLVPQTQAFELAIYLVPTKAPQPRPGGGTAAGGGAGRGGMEEGRRGEGEEEDDALSDADSDVDALLASTPASVPSPESLSCPSTLVPHPEWDADRAEREGAGGALSAEDIALKMKRLEGYPDVRMRIEHVHGYGGVGGRGNV
ncbi:hypothetical protein T484DRAFT_1813364, partial [Baffinella frigidus]